MTTTYPLLIPFQHRLSFDLSQKLGVGLGQRRPTPISCHQLNVKQLTEIVAQASEEAEALRLQRGRFGIEKGHIGRGTGEKRLYILRLLSFAAPPASEAGLGCLSIGLCLSTSAFVATVPCVSGHYSAKIGASPYSLVGGAYRSWQLGDGR